ncbi:hypothetical protein ACHAXA_010632 [Cyclostephanos tholiformis]|uniref:Uncharacterized protein n=1 Tax=Cyclostephanos tholiformis TaxID=382380 RepID=A0ABD3R8W8_9STRA
MINIVVAVSPPRATMDARVGGGRGEGQDDDCNHDHNRDDDDSRQQRQRLQTMTRIQAEKIMFNSATYMPTTWIQTRLIVGGATPGSRSRGVGYARNHAVSLQYLLFPDDDVECEDGIKEEEEEEDDDNDDDDVKYEGCACSNGGHGDEGGEGGRKGLCQRQSCRRQRHHYLCIMDADDIMKPTRIAEQTLAMMKLSKDVWEKTLMGCQFDHIPRNSTLHYTTWANMLTDNRLYLECYCECTLALHRCIKEIDRTGKALFKEKRYVEAAETFMEALDLIKSRRNAASITSPPSLHSNSDTPNISNVAKLSLTRQIVTLHNNQSAMYEKASLPNLALADCNAVLDLDPRHSKACARQLRILESQHRHAEALVEVCALQLKFMTDNRDKLRLGLPMGNPLVAQSKIEELVTLIQQGEIERAKKVIKAQDKKERPLPSTYTITQLLTSFSGYNRWMSKAAKGGTTAKFTSQIEDLLDHVPRTNLVAYADNVVMKATLLLQRGKRYAFEKDYASAVKDFEEAYALVEDEGGKDKVDHREAKLEIVKAMEKDDYARLLEWSGMCKHLRYELKGASECYECCLAIEPENTELLVKRAGVKMDKWDHSAAEVLFTKALALNPTASDRLLYRANMRMLQQRVSNSQNDLETCIRLYPNNLLARLRLATVYMAKEDMDGTNRILDQAEEYDLNSSEVHCYHGDSIMS